MMIKLQIYCGPDFIRNLWALDENVNETKSAKIYEFFITFKVLDYNKAFKEILER